MVGFNWLGNAQGKSNQIKHLITRNGVKMDVPKMMAYELASTQYKKKKEQEKKTFPC
jgi:hypothetical protein